MIGIPHRAQTISKHNLILYILLVYSLRSHFIAFDFGVFLPVECEKLLELVIDSYFKHSP